MADVEGKLAAKRTVMAVDRRSSADILKILNRYDWRDE